MRTSDVLIWIGAVVLLLGVLLRFVPGLFSWFGNLPGDIRIQGENSSVFIPITSMLIVSVAVSIVLSVVIRFLRG
ncbi:MAG: DUF2905 domain-containing protein [Acidimicrobiia bacterium]